MQGFNTPSRHLALAIVAGAIVVGTGAWWVVAANRPAESSPDLVASAEPVRHAVHVRQPDGPPRVATGKVDFRGQPVTVSCTTCHATRTPDASNFAGEQLDEFHQGLVVKHGELTCLSCHNNNDYDTLRHADGRSIEFTNVMTLCAQCHGPQKRDYDHGSHGGMNGHWDLTRGPRTRNNCIDCHDPHAPAYPVVRPVFKPRDRNPAANGSDHGKAAHDE